MSCSINATRMIRSSSVKNLTNSKVRQLMKEFDIPGLGLTVISPDLSFEKTYGVTNKITREKPTINTLWQVASLSKHVSATCLAWLEVDPYTRINNSRTQVEFQDKLVTRNVNIRDCMSHTSGAPPEGEFLIEINTGYSRKTAYNSIVTKPNVGFRLNFNYTNIVYTLGFEKAARILNLSYFEALERFFAVVGMTSTECDTDKYKDRIATQYSLSGSEHKFAHTNQFAPAGGVATSVKDLTTFLRLHLNPPRWLKNSIIYEPVVESPPPNNDFYGLGTCLVRYIRNNLVYYHNGLLTTGVASIVFYDIKNQIGISVVSNSTNPAIQALAIYIYYLLMDESEEQAEQALQTNLDIIVPLLDGIEGCSLELPPNKLYSSKFDGNYKSTSGMDIRIEDGKIQLGRLKPVKIYGDKKKFYAKPEDINGQSIPVVVVPILEKDKVVGLSVNLTCKYLLFNKI